MPNAHNRTPVPVPVSDEPDAWHAAHRRYMSALSPSFGQRLWRHWRRLFPVLLVNGLLILFPLLYVLYQAAHR
jgi:hypothetical protein